LEELIKKEGKTKETIALGKTGKQKQQRQVVKPIKINTRPKT
jgi:hypothetical protein